MTTSQRIFHFRFTACFYFRCAQAKADALQALLACQEQRESLARRTEMEGREIHSLRKQVRALFGGHA
jgi:cell division protein FtsB